MSTLDARFLIAPELPILTCKDIIPRGKYCFAQRAKSWERRAFWAPPTNSGFHLRIVLDSGAANRAG